MERNDKSRDTTIRIDRPLHDAIGQMRQLDESYADAIRKLMRDAREGK